MSSNSYTSGYRWYVCYEQTLDRIDKKKYTCMQTTFEEAINPNETGRFVFIPQYVPPLLDAVIIKSKLTDTVDIKIIHE